jgi:PhoH-like ATPase
VAASDYENSKVALDDMYTGVREIETDGGTIDSIHDPANGGVPLERVVSGGALPNEFFIITNRNNPSHTVICRYDGDRRRLVPVRSKADAWGLTPRNAEQRFALELLLNDDIRVVTLVGKAGTGKTLLAMAAGLTKVADEGTYKRLLVSRPVFPMGRDIGFLPGTIEEKLNPWMQPIFDNAEFLLSEYGGKKAAKKQGRRRGKQEPEDKDDAKFSSGYLELVEMGVMKIEPLMYIRGRSIPYQFMIVDEAQNLTPHEVKTIVTRAGEGTKIILTGDPQQIDNPYVDASSNGLTYLVERFKAQKIAGHITLTKGERSELAELASILL